jgi:hypothetical protein
MSNHTGTVRACQDHAHPPREETTPAPSSTMTDTIDRRLVQRYGLALLTGGYTALPTYAWVYYARLGVTEAEMVCLAQLCTYWWSTRDPYPGEAALAARMGKTVRTIQGYLRSLEGKGLLHIQTQFSAHGRQSTNAYDLRPFFAAVEGLARLDGLLSELDGQFADDSLLAYDADTDTDDTAPTTPPTPAMTARGSQRRPQRAGDTAARVGKPKGQPTTPTQEAEREPLCADAGRGGPDKRPTGDGTPTRGEGERLRGGGVKNPSPQVNPIEIESFDLDSRPPTPVNERVGPTASDDDPTDQALAQEIAALSVELGDNAPMSSVTRARNLCHNAGVSSERFLRLLDEAAVRTRDRQASIVKRRRDGTSPNGMPYLFAVLTDLLHPAPVTTRAVASDRRRAGRSPRRSRRDTTGPSVVAYGAWQGTAARRPVTEEHPVWRAVLDELAQALTTENFNTWLAATRVVTQEGSLLHVAVADATQHAWLDQRWRALIERTLRRVAPGVGVCFTVASAGAA